MFNDNKDSIDWLAVLLLITGAVIILLLTNEIESVRRTGIL